MQKVIYIFCLFYFAGFIGLAHSNHVVASEKVDRETSFKKFIGAFVKPNPKAIESVNTFDEMFRQGKVSGQIRSIYANYNYKEAGEANTYATALGGMLKYETASFEGFNAALAIAGSQDLGFISGDTLQAKRNSELSSPTKSYMALSQAYINYEKDGFNIRLGRQLIDTPLADTDDSSMIANSFEAYMLTYTLNKYTFTLGNIQSWQGSGAGLGYINDTKQNTNWVDMQGRGTSMVGISYDEVLKINAWYYDFLEKDNMSRSTYLELGYHEFKEHVSLHGSVQYLHQSGVDNSEIQADIYGVLLELIVLDTGLNIAYNKSSKNVAKRSFSGLGGGALYTSMDTMLLDAISYDREASALVLGLEYDTHAVKLIYAYGSFEGKEDSLGKTVEIIEHNIGVEYSPNDALTFVGIYVKEEDKQSAVATAKDWQRLQITMTYNF